MISNVVSIIKSTLFIFKNQIHRRWPFSLREWIIFSFLGGYLILGYESFFWGFRFVYSFPIVGELLLDRLLHFLFFILWLMLIFSNAVVAYGIQYRAPETFFLFSMPISPRIIFFKQLFEATIWSSWGFLFLFFPFFIAFGIATKSSWIYYVLSAVFIFLFVISASILGSFLTYISLKLSKRRKSSLIIGLLFIFFIITLVYLLKFPSELAGDSDYQILSFMKKFLEGLSFCRSNFIPSSWLAKGLLLISHGKTMEGLFFLMVLLSITVLFLDLAFIFSKKYYPQVWERAQESKSFSTQTLFSKMIHRVRMSCWIQKDILCLVRDPSQWIQLVLLGAMMILYTTNLKNIQAYVDHPYWRNTIYFLNLAAIGLMIGTLCLRFVFPQFSLEWRKDWLTALAPEKPKDFFKVKFYFPFLLFTILGQGISLLSNIILEASLSRILLASFILCLITVGLIWISLGLGTLYPNFSTDNPSKIMSGLGGILTLIVSMSYLIVMIMPISFPFHRIALGKSFISAAFYIKIGMGILFDIGLTGTIIGFFMKKSQAQVRDK